MRTMGCMRPWYRRGPVFASTLALSGPHRAASPTSSSASPADFGSTQAGVRARAAPSSTAFGTATSGAAGGCIDGACALPGAVHAQTRPVRRDPGGFSGPGGRYRRRLPAPWPTNQGPAGRRASWWQSEARAGGQDRRRSARGRSTGRQTRFLEPRPHHPHPAAGGGRKPRVRARPKDFVFPSAGFATFANCARCLEAVRPAKTTAEQHGLGGASRDGRRARWRRPCTRPDTGTAWSEVLGETKLDLVAAPDRRAQRSHDRRHAGQPDRQPGVGSVPDFIENHKAGKIRIVAVLGGSRQAILPDVPTFSEPWPVSEDMPYYGLFAPAGTLRRPHC